MFNLGHSSSSGSEASGGFFTMNSQRKNSTEEVNYFSNTNSNNAFSRSNSITMPGNAFNGSGGSINQRCSTPKTGEKQVGDIDVSKRRSAEASSLHDPNKLVTAPIKQSAVVRTNDSDVSANGSGKQNRTIDQERTPSKITSSPRKKQKLITLNDKIMAVYSLWQKHVPNLYDFCTTHILDSPSATVQWIPESRRSITDRNYCAAQLCVGSQYICGTANHATIYQTFYHCAVNSDQFSGGLGEFGGGEVEGTFGLTGGNNDDTRAAVADQHGLALDYGDVAPVMSVHTSIACASGPLATIRVSQRIPRLLAMRGRSSGDIAVVDTSRVSSIAPQTMPIADGGYSYGTGFGSGSNNSSNSQCHVKLGSSSTGRGMEWSPLEDGWIAAAKNDATVNIYDLSTEVSDFGTRDISAQKPVFSLSGGHTGIISDVSWHSSYNTVLATVSWDNSLRLWDIRQSTKKEVQSHSNAHNNAPVHTCAFHPSAVFLVATGGSDKSVRIWDIRKLTKAMPTAHLIGHRDAVHGVRWAPFSDAVLMSYGPDRTVCCWDLSLLGNGARYFKDHGVRDELGHEALVFQHLGHTAAVREASWSPFECDPWVVASVDDNNALMLWSPHENVINGTSDADAPTINTVI